MSRNRKYKSKGLIQAQQLNEGLKADWVEGEDPGRIDPASFNPEAEAMAEEEGAEEEE